LPYLSLNITGNPRRLDYHLTVYGILTKDTHTTALSLGVIDLIHRPDLTKGASISASQVVKVIFTLIPPIINFKS
jgi:hypothetical protein